MTDNIWSVIGVAAVAYFIYRWYKKGQGPTLTLLQGGKPPEQYQPTHGPEPQLQGSFPEIAVVSWPGGFGKCC